jgi:nitric oxide reductase NorD protein
VDAAVPERLERLTLLASAIAGRFAEVAPAVRGDGAWTDGLSIFVDAGASPDEQRRRVAVQAALLGAGSFASEVVGRLRRLTLSQRYLAIEGHRALAAHVAVLPPSVRSLLDGSVAERSDSPSASLAIAASRERIDDPPASFGTIRPRKIRAAASTAADLRVDAGLDARDPHRGTGEQFSELDDREDDEGPVLELLASPVGGGGPIGRLLRRMFSDARSRGGGPPGADAPTHTTRRGRGKSRRTVLATTAPSIADHALPGTPRGTTYPEWDVHHHRYRPDWCTVVEVDAYREQPLAVPDTHELRRSLARLGLGFERRHRQLHGDDIDIDAAVEARVDAAAGSATDEAVYVDSVRCRRDLAVLLLLDASGSAGEPSGTGTTVHDRQRAAAAILARSLHDLGDRVALYAFRSQGRSAVNLVPLKRFAGPLDGTVLRRLGGLDPGGYTRLGAAIRHGAAVLEETAGTPRRLLVVLSDGFAYDHGYEGVYGEADARRALAEARRRGTGCLCLSIGAATHPAALRRVFGTAAHAAIPRLEQLPSVLGPLFRAALHSAELQRRRSQRRQRTRERLGIEGRTA